ncbi:MAG: F0F1 ATP synthase subunit gamma [Dysgonamonadaceae bacterium]|jgi:F-type H+-transporting ATPase subunit gamma|nr:F0F1 ATP synthase subunit gamma [Dysgonamonadaceae bacterium]
MASLKEIKGRIASVKSTQKITSAMKMVASAKLRKAQYQIERFLPYQKKLNEILNSFMSSITDDFDSKLAEEREVKKVAVLVVSSNSSLCGAFNSNIIKLLNDTLNKYKHLGCDNVEIYTVGKKVEEYASRLTLPFKLKGGYIDLMDKPDFEGAKQIADELIHKFSHSEVDRVEILYNHYKNTVIQIPTTERYLPIDLSPEEEIESSVYSDYIVEPDQNTILHSLIPKSLHSKIYAVLLDSAAAEQAARVMAMQIATDNADDLLEELTLLFNKQRQQVITNELLDILGGSNG